MQKSESTTRMEEWFLGRELPAGPLRLENAETIHEVEKYVAANLAGLRNCESGNKGAARQLYEYYYMRLYRLKKYIESIENG